MATYNDLVNVEEFWGKKEHFSQDRGDIAYYCKDCEKLIEVEEEKPFVFRCLECESCNVVIGTEAGLSGHFRIWK